MLEEFVMIPGSSKQFIIARVSVIIAVYMMLFISSLPIISLSCIYSGLPWRKIIRLGIMLFFCTFWSASVSIFSFSYCKKGIWAFAQNTVISVFKSNKRHHYSIRKSFCIRIICRFSLSFILFSVFYKKIRTIFLYFSQ